VAQVDAVDGSTAQHAMATELYGDLAPRLRLVHADAVAHLRGSVGEYDVLYSVFGAVDFTDPYELLPAACAALKPGGRLVFATLAHDVGGAPARDEVVPARISARRPDGGAATMARWVLREEVWAELLAQAGMAGVSSEVLPGSGEGARDADTLLVTAFRSGSPYG
jgi:SAM-dependent methyltransferase